MTKLQKILSGILVLQIVLIGWVFWPEQSESGKQALLLGDLQIEDVVDLKITDDTGKAIHFTKDGSDWTLPEAGGYPVEGTKIENVLEHAIKVNADRMVTETEASHKQLQVGDTDYIRKVELVLADGTRTGFYVGSNAGPGTAHIRKFDDGQVYLTDELTAYDLSVSSSGWIDTTYVNVPSTTVNAISITNQNGELLFQKDASGEWLLSGLEAGAAVDGAAVDSLVGTAAAMRMVEPISNEINAEFGLDDPSAVIVFTAQDEAGNVTTHQIGIGSMDAENGNYYAYYQGSAYYVQISAYTAEQFTQADLDDFIEAQATPTSPAVE